MQDKPMSPSWIRVMAAFAVICLIWGSTYLAIRYAVQTIPPLLMMGTRHFVAGATLYGWMRLRGAGAPGRRAWLAALLTGGLLFLGGHGTLAWAEKTVPSGLAALLNATLPLCVVLLQWKRTKFSARLAAGLILGIAGVALLIGANLNSEMHRANLLGMAALLAGTVFWAAGSLQNKRLPQSAVLAAGMQMLSGGTLLLLLGGVSGEAMHLHIATFTVRSLLSLAYLILFGSLIAFTTYTWLLRVLPPARVSTFAFVNPVVAVVLGWAIGGEPLHLRTIVAAAVILTSIALVGTHPEQITTPEQEKNSTAESLACEELDANKI